MFFLILSFFYPSLALAQGDYGIKNVVVVSIDNTSLQEILKIQAFRDIFEFCSYGLLVTRSGAPYKATERGSSYATISSSEKLDIPSVYATQQFNEEEIVTTYMNQAKSIYIQRMGEKPEGFIVSIEFPSLKKIAYKESFATIGKLGSFFRKNNISISAYGNSDTATYFDRSFALAGVDNSGTIQYGNVSRETLIKDPTFPGGYRTNYELLLKLVTQKVEDDSSNKKLIWVDTGDTVRLEKLKEEILPTRYGNLRNKALKNIAVFIKDLRNNLNLKRDNLIIISTVTDQESASKGDTLTYVLFMGKGFGEETLVYSKTTKIKGLVTLVDLPPTLSKLFDIKDSSESDFPGNIIKNENKSKSVDWLQNRHKQFANIESVRSELLTAYVIFVILGTLLLLTGLFVEIPFFNDKIYGFIIYAVVFTPIFLLLIGPYLASNPINGIILIVTLVFLSSALVSVLKNISIISLSSIALFSSFFVLLDTLTGYNFLRLSVLSYSPMIGARFYGVGNEFAGIVISGAMFGAPLIYRFFERKSGNLGKGTEKPGKSREKYGESKKRRNYRTLSIVTISLFSIIVVFILGYPLFGANIGGALAAAFAFSITIIYYLKRRIGLREVVTGVLVLVVVLTALALFSMSFPSFHFSKFISNLLSGNIDSVWAVLIRKISMNIKLLKYTIWSDVLLIIVLSMPVIFLNPKGITRKALAKTEWLTPVFVGCSLGALAAFVLNDSGVIAAATTLIFPFYCFLALLTKEKTSV